MYRAVCSAVLGAVLAMCCEFEDARCDDGLQTLLVRRLFDVRCGYFAKQVCAHMHVYPAIIIAAAEPPDIGTPRDPDRCLQFQR